MTRRRVTVLAAATLLVVVAVAGAPVALRHVPFFRIRQVEFIGVKYLSPDSLLTALGAGGDAAPNVFDDPDPILERLHAVDGVVSVRIERKLPGTLRVLVVERVPVAFVAGGARLVALDGEGAALPYDAAGTVLDLPFIARPDSQLVRTLSVIRSTDSTLFREIDGARQEQRGIIRLDIGREQVLLRGVPAPEDVRAVAAVRRHLAGMGRPYRQLDTRYRGWVVVRRNLS